MRYKQSKTIKLVLTLVLSLSLCLVPISLSYANNATTELLPGVPEEMQSVIKSSGFDFKRLANLDISRELYIKLIESFSEEPVPDASDYPDWYGGCYMNDQGKMVIYVTPDYSEGRQLSKVKEEVISIVGSDDILFEPCEYSFRHLTETVDYLNSIKLSSKKSTIADSFNSLGINDKENRVYVYLVESNTDKMINEFRNSVDGSNCIIFAESKGLSVSHGDIDPGDKIQSKSSGSMGYRAKYKNAQGFVTAAHITSHPDTAPLVSYNGSFIAEVILRNWGNSSDVAFCRLIPSSPVTPTNDIVGGTLLTSTLNPAVGDIVYKVGAKTGLTGGTVKSTNFTDFIDGLYFTNLSSASYASQGGDSGGLVYTFNMSTSTGYTVGIHTAGSSSISIYTKASVANSTLGITRY